MHVNPNVVKASALVAGGLVVGGGAGYLLAKHRYNTKYRALAEDEIEAYKDSHNRLHKVGKYSSPITAVDLESEEETAEYEDYVSQLSDLGYDSSRVQLDDISDEEKQRRRAIRKADRRLDDESEETLEEEFNRIQRDGIAAREAREKRESEDPRYYDDEPVDLNDETLEEENRRVQLAGIAIQENQVGFYSLEEREAMEDLAKQDALLTAGQAEANRILKAHGLSEDDSDDTPEEAVERADILENIFSVDQDVIMAEIKASRSSDKPYVIGVDEYMLGKDGYTQTTYTYYEADNTLTDERESILPDFQEYVGAENLSLFGFESGDPNVVYVRNEKHLVDYEIVRMSGSYAELFGVEDEDHIDAPRKNRKMRHDRDD